MSSERDACLFFNIARIEAAVKAGKFKTVGDSKVPVVDGTRESNKDPKTALTAYVSVPKNPHGVNASPDGKYFVCAGELSPTATVIELAKVLDWFEGKLEKADKAIVAEVELGLGPLHTAFDGRGNAYTTLFLDSQVVKWNVDAAIKFAAGDKNSKYVVDRVDVQYQPGHLNASQSETRAADGKWLAVGCKFSKDRFLPAGPLHPENEQLIDISGEKMVLLAAPLLERVGLAHAAARPVREYSKGMRQRLGFAQALLGRPSVLFLDEPTTGLDPAAIRDFYATLASLREQGTTVVVTSHILAELQERVDRLALLAAGRVRAAGSVQALRERIALPLRVSLRAHAGAVPALREALAPLPLSAASWRGDELQAQLPRSAKMPLLAAIAALPGAADDVQVHEPSLEDVYFGLAA
jgi:ABC-type dipeptide/oligopeptide/nickel transport system ATPase component